MVQIRLDVRILHEIDELFHDYLSRCKKGITHISGVVGS